jgi:putative salt-induced outer membrane protein YdiY
MQTGFSIKSCLALAFSSILAVNGFAADVEYDLEGGIIEEVVTPKAWDGSFAAGLNGKTGNSENLDINMNLNMTRTVGASTTKFQLSYFYASNDVATTTDRLFALSRHEHAFDSHPRWSCFVQSTYETDRFKDFDFLLGLHSGLGYKVYENEAGFFKTRVGLGTSRQFGGVDDDWKPELQFGADWEKRLSSHSKMFATVDFFPNISDFADHRLITNAGFEFVIDEELNLNLRIFALDKFDSTPEPGNQENDLDYGVAIVYGF